MVKHLRWHFSKKRLCQLWECGVSQCFSIQLHGAWGAGFLYTQDSLIISFLRFLVKAENVCWSPIYSCLLQPQPNLRTTYLAMLTTRRLLVSRTALSSVLEFFPIFRDFLCKLFYAHGGSCLETQFIESIYG